MNDVVLSRVQYDDTLCAGTVANVIIINWRQKLTTEGLWRLAELVDRFIASRSERIGIMVWLDAGLPAPTATERRVVASIMGSQSQSVAGSLVLFDDSGLKEDVWRVTAAALRHYAAVDAPALICSNIDEACLEMESVLRRASVWPEGLDLAAAARAVKDHGRA